MEMERREKRLNVFEQEAMKRELEQVLKDHDLPVKRFPMQRFSLPLTAWREGSF